MRTNGSMVIDRLTSKLAFLFDIELGTKIDDDRINLGITE